MRNATLIALIAAAIDTLASLYYLLIDLRVLEYDDEFSQFIRPLFFLSSVGLLVFFAILFQKQSKK